MGNNNGRCICYTENKKLCTNCNVKYCGKCLIPKYGTKSQHFCEMKCCGAVISCDKEVNTHKCRLYEHNYSTYRPYYPPYVNETNYTNTSKEENEKEEDRWERCNICNEVYFSPGSCPRSFYHYS